MDSLEERVAKIEARNRAVEADKAWEISWMRKILIALLTYIIVGIFLQYIHVQDPWISALVPVIGFVLSTATMNFFKGLWIRRFHE